jgi:uncharacterized membrane protein YebE (DUF533 family)
MFDPKKLLDDLLGSQVPGGQGTVRDKAGQAVDLARNNPIATGAIAAVLLGTGTGRAIAGLAYKAYQNYQQGNQPAEAARTGPELLPPPSDTSFHPSQMPQGEAEFALTLVRAMILAARADGHIDDAERARIGDRVKLAGIDTEASQFLAAELERPFNLDELVAAAQTDAQKVELYTASRLAIEPETRAERGYLDMLAGRLKLPDALVDHVEATVSAAKVPA